MKKFLKNNKAAVVASSMTAAALVSTVSRADIATDITAAFTAGQANLTLVAGGVVSLAAIVTALTLIVRFLAK